MTVFFNKKWILMGLIFLLGQTANSQATMRVIGGDYADMDEFASAVSIHDEYGHFCGGVLIDESWVLSATHCFEFNDATHVIIGAVDLGVPEQGEKIKVEDIYPHPEYGKLNVISHDFALLKLNRPAKGYAIAKLNEKEPDKFQEKQLTVVGWGLTEEKGHDQSSHLKKAEVPTYEKEQCIENYIDYDPDMGSLINDTMFCAGLEEGGKDACQGDSGGPIYHWDEKSNELIVTGIVSWGAGCARPGLPGLYSDVSEVLDWISDKT
jgi:trypsin